MTTFSSSGEPSGAIRRRGRNDWYREAEPGKMSYKSIQVARCLRVSIEYKHTGLVVATCITSLNVCPGCLYIPAVSFNFHHTIASSLLTDDRADIISFEHLPETFHQSVCRQSGVCCCPSHNFPSHCRFNFEIRSLYDLLATTWCWNTFQSRDYEAHIEVRTEPHSNIAIFWYLNTTCEKTAKDGNKLSTADSHLKNECVLSDTPNFVITNAECSMSSANVTHDLEVQHQRDW